MALVTAVGALSAWVTKRSSAGAMAGGLISSVFGASGYKIQHNEDHELAHQAALLSSMAFAGAMSYRAANNPMIGPGGSMLAALGGVSSAYHLAKLMEWRQYEIERLAEAEALLRGRIGDDVRAPPGGF